MLGSIGFALDVFLISTTMLVVICLPVYINPLASSHTVPPRQVAHFSVKVWVKPVILTANNQNKKIFFRIVFIGSEIKKEADNKLPASKVIKIIEQLLTYPKHGCFRLLLCNNIYPALVASSCIGKCCYYLLTMLF